MFRYPERMPDFSPTWSAAECGVIWGDATDNGVLKGRPNMYCIVNHHLQFISSLQDSLYIPLK
ncbi:hypothetical protein Barb6XT_02206 [Bacteroidales bacterium Barb6XT]|nr:hypothetical protein Barb6XT_02206 [Bacteroidales bacterium Barb6XT]